MSCQRFLAPCQSGSWQGVTDDRVKQEIINLGANAFQDISEYAQESRCASTTKGMSSYRLAYGGSARVEVQKRYAWKNSVYFTVPENGLVTAKYVCYCNSGSTFLYINGTHKTTITQVASDNSCQHRLRIDNRSRD
ncbi:MAG: hypothetical protein IBX55_19365 [Methyloprofundus sp.]|nr:hypothetical protein [Methyloprofundus sp.]